MLMKRFNPTRRGSLRHAFLSPRMTSERAISLSPVRCWQVFENERHYEPGEDVVNRVKHALTYDLRRASRRYKEAKYDAFRRLYPIAHMKRGTFDYEVLPFRTEFLIIGGGLTGSATAFWLKQRFRDEELTVTVVENPENLEKSRSMSSTGVISQQFAIPEFVEMAMFSAEFIRHAGEHLKILDNDPPDVNLLPVNFLHLARNDAEAESMKDAWKIQVEKGAKVLYMGVDELRRKLPFMKLDDVVAGTLGTENEGLFDTWQLLAALREKNITLGVRYVKGEVEGMSYLKYKLWSDAELVDDEEVAEAFLHRRWIIDGAMVRPQMTAASARPVRAAQIINASGPWSGDIARMARMGKGRGLLSVPMPIVCKRRTCYLIHAPDVPVLEMPALVDPSGIFCRPDISVGFNYVVGKLPTKADIVAKDAASEEIDYERFYNEIWPLLVQRVPAFKTAKMVNAWNTYEDANTFDSAPILGEHLLYRNFYQMCGLGGYGSQLSLAIGKLYSERIYDGAYTSTNVRKFDMRRIMQGTRFTEPYRCI